jgi:hypothetical protein
MHFVRELVKNTCITYQVARLMSLRQGTNEMKLLPFC